VTGNHLIEGIADTNEGLLQILRAKAQSIEQGTMGTAGSALLDNITSHISALLT
jgi:hypothetical protein